VVPECDAHRAGNGNSGGQDQRANISAGGFTPAGLSQGRESALTQAMEMSMLFKPYFYYVGLAGIAFWGAAIYALA
jgi:hypothetical protein